MTEQTDQESNRIGNKEEGQQSEVESQKAPADIKDTQSDQHNLESNLDANVMGNKDDTHTMMQPTAEGEDGRAKDGQKEPPLSSLIGLDEIMKDVEESSAGSETNNDLELSSKEEVVDDLAHIIEAIIFASDEPLSVSTIKSVLDAAHTFGKVKPDMVMARIDALNHKYDQDGNGFHIIEVANGYQFATRKELAQWVSYLFKEKAKRKLSNSALETLAIIAYKQPVTKPEIESIRGVNIDYVLHNLLEKEIVTVVGRAETVGRPLLYGTTQRFLKIFALKNLEDLPKLREIEEIIKEIRSKGAEESIQLEITALGEQIATEPSKDVSEDKESAVKTGNPQEDGTAARE